MQWVGGWVGVGFGQGHAANVPAVGCLLFALVGHPWLKKRGAVSLVGCLRPHPQSPGQELRALPQAPKDAPVRLGSSMEAQAAFSAIGRSMPEDPC